MPVDPSRYENEVVRAGAHAGLSILAMMEKEMLDAALRGAADSYLEGVATAITIVRSPYSWQDQDPRIKRAIRELIREARSRSDLL